MFFSDEAITVSSEDLLDRSDFAKSTARALLNLTSNNTYTVGLFGKWGSGKTSLLNMILQEINRLEEKNNEADKTVIIHFEPWNFSSTDQLLSQFFVRLINEFKSASDTKLQSVASAIEKYSFAFDLAKAIPFVGEGIQSAAKQGAMLFADKISHGANERDITKQKENVIQMLKTQSRRLLIVVDDIDRLSNEQIRALFQLITSVARFPKTTYLLAFDKDIVVRALEEVQKGKGEDYLEKIIQVPIQMPVLNPGKLREVLFNRLNEVISENERLQFSAEYWQQKFPVCIDPFIQTLRDVNRLCNSLRFKLQAIAEEVDFTDMTAITTLEINYPQIFEWIIANKDLLTGDMSTRLIGSHRWKVEEWKRLTSEYWKELLLSDNDNNSKFEDSLQKVSEAICCLFPALGEKIRASSMYANPYNDHRLRAGSHIGHREKFDRYFQLSLSDRSISHSDVVKTIDLLNRDDLIEFLKRTDIEGKSYELLEEITSYLPKITEDRAGIIIEALFQVSASFDKTPHGPLSLSSSRYAEMLLLNLFELLPSDRRFPLLIEITNTANRIVLETLAHLLNLEELGYGRLAANGEMREFQKIISEEELNQWEGLFVCKAKEILEQNSLLDFEDYQMVLYLFEQLDSEFIHDYIRILFKEPINIIRFLEYMVSKWIGGSISYEINENYKRYLNDREIITAIEECRNNKSLFYVPENVQLMGAVFWLYFDNKCDFAKHVSEKAAKQLLTDWIAIAFRT